MLNLFQYLENVKGKPIPLEYKLLNEIPLSNNDLIVNGDLHLAYSKIKQLPNNLTINGYLSLFKTKIKQLPDNLTVNSNLYCWGTPLAKNIKNNPSLLKQYSKQIKGEIFYG